MHYFTSPWPVTLTKILALRQMVRTCIKARRKCGNFGRNCKFFSTPCTYPWKGFPAKFFEIAVVSKQTDARHNISIGWRYVHSFRYNTGTGEMDRTTKLVKNIMLCTQQKQKQKQPTKKNNYIYMCTNEQDGRKMATYRLHFMHAILSATTKRYWIQYTWTHLIPVR